MTNTDEEPGWATARVLAEALPFIQVHDRETVVIKYGGHAMGEEDTAKAFAADAVLLKLLGVRPVVVHGGGPQISRMMERAGVQTTFIDGLRVTDGADHGGRRDGPVRRDQQGDRQLDHPGRRHGRRARRRPLRQGCAPDHRGEGDAHPHRSRRPGSSRSSTSASSASPRGSTPSCCAA